MSGFPVIIVGQMPPPIHGQSVAIERISRIRSDRFEIITLPMNCSADIESVGRFQWDKIATIVRVARRLRELVRRRGEVIVYYPPASPAWIPVLRDLIFFALARGGGRRWIFHFHAGGLPEFLCSGFLGRLAKRIYPEPRVCISMSRDSAPTPGEFFGGEDAYIPYGLEMPLPFEARGHLPERRMLFVGNLFISKGVAMCLRALSSLREQGLPLKLDLVGGHVEGDREAILRLVRDLGVGDHVEFHGILSGAAKWERFKEADCFVFPSHYPAEKFPNVLIEALGAGLPVVSTRWRGIPELIGDGVEGSHLIEVNDQAALEASLRLVIEADDSRYADFRRSSRKRYETCYTLDQFNRRMLDAFSKAV